MLRDSNTGTPDTPPVSNGGSGGNGNGEGEGEGEGEGPGNGNGGGTEVTPLVERLVVTGRVDKFSKEGQAPNLSGLTIEVWYKSGSVKAAVAGDILTIPAILGEAETNAEDPAEALPVAVTIYHKDDASARATVMLPGVNALVFDSRGDASANVDSGWADGHLTTSAAATTKAAVFGNGDDTEPGVAIESGASVGGDIYQDGELPDFVYPSVYVKYQGFGSGLTKTWLDTADDTNNGEETENEGLYRWEKLTLNKNYIFDDYNTSFREIDDLASTDKRFAYGIDSEQGFAYFLISKGRTHGSTPAATGLNATVNSSIYVRVPYTGTFHYVRYVEVEELSWESSEPEKYPFLTQAEALKVGGRTAWTTKLLTRSNLKLRVYYYSGESIVRDIDFFRKAVNLKVAGVVNNPTTSLLLDSSEDNFGELLIGYYTSTAIYDDVRDPIGKGDGTNVAVHKLPIATFVEGSGNLQKQKTAGEGEAKDLIFIEPPTGWTGRISDERLGWVQTTYDFWGRFTYAPTNQTVDGAIIPGADFRVNFFPGNPLRNLREVGDVEISFVVPNKGQLSSSASALNADNSDGSFSGDKLNAYAFFAGEEGLFTVKAYPRDYDQWE